MADALEDFNRSGKVGGRCVTNLRFADDIDLIAGSRAELADLTSRLDITARCYGMEISNEKSKVMVTSKQRDDGNLDNEEVKVDGNTLEGVARFLYLGSTLNADVTSDNEIKKQLAIATDQLAKLNRIWSANNISLPIKTNLMKSLITSIALYGCES